MSAGKAQKIALVRVKVKRMGKINRYCTINRISQSLSIHGLL